MNIIPNPNRDPYDRRKSRPYQSGISNSFPLTPDELYAREQIRLAYRALENMRLCLELYMPQRTFRWN